MKHSFILIILFVKLTTCFAQKAVKEQFFLFDSRMNGVSKTDSAAFLMRVANFSDTLWQFDTYNIWGPLISSEQYLDREGSKAGGRFTFYHRTGYIDSTGMVVNGRLDGDWNFCNDTGKVIKQKTYASGRLIKTRDLLQEEKQTSDTAVTKTFNKTEVESEFIGGVGSWQRYLNKNLRYPERAMNSNITGKVVVQFMVTTEGRTMDVAIHKSVEYS